MICSPDPALQEIAKARGDEGRIALSRIVYKWLNFVDAPERLQWTKSF